MTHHYHRAVGVAALAAASLVACATPAAAQCSTCATPTVAFVQPTVAVPTVTTWSRPGLFDRWRMRRWGVTPAPVVATWAPQATAFAPVASVPVASSWTPQVVGYAPAASTWNTQVVGFTPAASTWTPHFAAFAPLPVRSSAVVQTSFFAPASDGCSTCGQTSCGCATAVLRPVITEPACTTCNFGCSTCSLETPCSSCAAAAEQQVAFSQPASGCSSCGTVTSPATPQPQMTPQEAAPAAGELPGYPVNPAPSSPTPDPAPAAEDASTYLAPPQLLGPANDRTVSRPTVDVHNAVYRQPATTAAVSSAAAKPASAVRTKAQIDAEGWESTPVAR